jgi:hypothetical protein
MARRSPQSVLKRAREQAQREKRELKQAKKDARAAERRNAADPNYVAPEAEGSDEDGLEPADGSDEGQPVSDAEQPVSDEEPAAS